MKVLITGMTSRQTNTRRTPLSMAALMAHAMEEDGHDVTVKRLLAATDPLWDYDAVVVGLSSPLSPSARYAIPALCALQDAKESGALKGVFVDDPDVRKLWYGSKSVLAKPERLWSSFYSGRPAVADTSGDPAVRRIVLDMLQWVQDGLDGTVQVWWPAHPWASDATVNSMLLSHGRTDQSGITGVDLTPALLDYPVHRPMVNPGEGWIEEIEHSVERMVFDPSSTRYSMPFQSVGSDIERTLGMYQFSYGVVQGVTGNNGHGGWWTPTPGLALLADRIYVPSLDEGTLMGGPYYHLPSELEYLEDGRYEELRQEQEHHLKEQSWSMERLRTEMSGALGA